MQYGAADMLAGANWTHIMWLFDPAVSPGLRERIIPWLRSPVVPQERLIEHECTL
jgi:hypothetical protein